MTQFVYSHQLGGRLTAVGPGALDAVLTAEREAATVVAQLSFADEHRFDLSGEIRFGGGHSIRFRTLGRGRLDPSPDPHLRHGVAMLDVCGGTGRFDGARGRITSNFVVSADGGITDHQLGIVFIAEQAKEQL
jgi:hypothetical protein